VARRTPKPGQKGSRRWRHFRRRQRLAEARHARRVRQAQHEAAKAVIGWAVEHKIGALAVGDPRGVLNVRAGRQHNQRTRDWRIGRLIAMLKDKAEVAGIGLALVDERGTSSTCPPATLGFPSLLGGCWLARPVSSPATAISPRQPLSPPDMAAGPRRPASRPTSRTAAPGRTFRVSPPRDVTRAAAPITAAPAGPMAGIGPPAPAAPKLARESLATRRGACNSPM
jgi:putative transposase